jgi:multimeric flavodoxin WrbA
MKHIVIIYGHQRKGSTYHIIKELKEHLTRLDEYVFTEYTMPRDLPKFCRGCFNCILRSEDTCPDHAAIDPIRQSIHESDGIVMASPVHCLDVSAGMKNLIDHMAYMWMPHRPNEALFEKIGLVVSSAAGSGTKRANQTMRKALVFMGFKRVHQLGFAVQASSFEDIKPSSRKKIERKTKTQAMSFHKHLNRRYKMSHTLFHRMLRKVMGWMIKGYDHGNIDRQYWVQKGWIKTSSEE